MGTKAPYYGNIAVAAMLGNLVDHPAAIASIDLGGNNQEAAYAAYIDSGKTLARVLVLNLNAYNSTVDGTGVSSLPAAKLDPRPSNKYTFAVEGLSSGKKLLLQRLMAGGSDAISGISWDGYSYNYEEAEGKPARLNNVTIGETVKAGNGGTITVEVPDSSAVMINFVTASTSDNGGSSGGALNHGESPGSAHASEPQKSGARRRMNILGWER